MEPEVAGSETLANPGTSTEESALANTLEANKISGTARTTSTRPKDVSNKSQPAQPADVSPEQGRD